MKDLHDIWPHRWVNPKAQISESAIHGIGLVAVEDIPNNEVIIMYGGVIVPHTDIAKYHQLIGQYNLPLDENFSIAPTSMEEIEKTGVVNHSCEPNLGFNNLISFKTIKDVSRGEELVLDYAFIGGYPKSFNCNCSTASCRKVITQDDWKNKELQEKYGEYFAPYLRSKFK